MADITVENIDVSIQIAESLDLNMLSNILPDSKYNPEETPILILHLKKPKSAIMLFSNGKVVFTGSKNMDEVDEIIKIIQNRLNTAGIRTNNKPDIKIRNIVVSTDTKKKLDLRLISKSFNNTEYDPKHFPGVIYRTNDPNTVILLFDSGKIVCHGIESEKISIAIDEVTKKLTSLRIL